MVHKIEQARTQTVVAESTYDDRLADTLDPPDDDRPVGTPYIARRLGQTTTWVAEMCRNGVIPKSCVLTGTGLGKPWKFHRQQIDKWIKTR